VRGLTVTVP